MPLLTGLVAGLSPRHRAFAALLSGALVATGHSPLSFWYVSLFALTFLLALYLNTVGTRAAFWVGWLGGCGYFAVTLFWIVEPFLVDAARHGWMAPFALGFMATGLALFWGTGFALAHWLGRGAGSRLVALIFALGLAELARSYVLTGFPWGLLAYIWTETPIVQLAAFVGPHGLGVLTLCIAALPLAPLRFPVGIFAAAGLLALAYGLGHGRAAHPPAPRAEPVALRLVQPNAPQTKKWDPEFAPLFLRRQMDLTAAEGALRPDLVIWPEAAVTFWLGTEPRLQAEIAAAAGPGSRVILGARRFAGRRIYNALAVLDDTGKAAQVYDKARLVPFGEYVPFDGLLSRFGFQGLAATQGGGFSAGSSGKLLDLGKSGLALPLICYEAIFPNLARSEPRADWILQITNDAWFGEIAGPQQHLAQARMRAIEQGLPLVRVANTGISAVIDATGAIVGALPLGKSGKLDALLPGRLPPTPYGKTGDWLMLFVLLAGCLAVGIWGTRKKD